MSLLNRLKLATLGLIALIMALVKPAMYFELTMAEAGITQREQMGAGPLMALNKVIQLTQSHRGLSAGLLSGNEGLAARRPAMRDAVGKAAQALDTEWSRCRGIAGRSDALVRFAAALGNAGTKRGEPSGQGARPHQGPHPADRRATAAQRRVARRIRPVARPGG